MCEDQQHGGLTVSKVSRVCLSHLLLLANWRRALASAAPRGVPGSKPFPREQELKPPLAQEAEYNQMAAVFPAKYQTGNSQ